MAAGRHLVKFMVNSLLIEALVNTLFTYGDAVSGRQLAADLLQGQGTEIKIVEHQCLQEQGPADL